MGKAEKLSSLSKKGGEFKAGVWVLCGSDFGEKIVCGVGCNSN